MTSFLFGSKSVILLFCHFIRRSAKSNSVFPCTMKNACINRYLDSQMFLSNMPFVNRPDFHSGIRSYNPTFGAIAIPVLIKRELLRVEQTQAFSNLLLLKNLL